MSLIAVEIVEARRVRAFFRPGDDDAATKRLIQEAVEVASALPAKGEDSNAH